ncbi:DNA-binding response OmpR family regulator [Paenibacillus sp. SORGH_AS306]|uniref:response regulator transcription factor n=1 Tax=unclassified Paenibacillus TaxID=185978 RepID=UPI0023660135|nr:MULTISPECIES: response regulator transcription factor [unclassified Paenibacillus]MDQ1233107.1 DNA-binding response OmpR family regulator [Paenibacillus sp. SORGH_AS_0306]MDR6110154.1 DNA-binding response OmpR family regulator [Paenibacillus sp. SORGH_AS_0338]WDF49784.1 response regulator transcription factor [Paenibacillus sp. KACC 21273]
MTKLFVVDDDPSILQLISEYLRKEQYEVFSFAHGQQLVEQVQHEHPDCLILDIMMPGIDGLTLLTELRTFTGIPIIMISARGEEVDRINGLELGCNDFLSKPFNPRELVARVKAMLRLIDTGKRASNPVSVSAVTDTATPSVPEASTSYVYAGNLSISEEFRQVLIQNNELYFTSREFELLLFLATHLQRPFSREQLIQQVWNYDFFGELRVVDDLVKRIRKKLVQYQSTLTIDTVWGFGYKAAIHE